MSTSLKLILALQFFNKGFHTPTNQISVASLGLFLRLAKLITQLFSQGSHDNKGMKHDGNSFGFEKMLCGNILITWGTNVIFVPCDILTEFTLCNWWGLDNEEVVKILLVYLSSSSRNTDNISLKFKWRQHKVLTFTHSQYSSDENHQCN